jgi:hypothetical protein
MPLIPCAWIPLYGVSLLLNSLSLCPSLLSRRCHERDLIGIECGLVDVAVEVTASWKPGQWASTFSDAKASTHPVLELSTDILMHLAHR